MSWHFDNDGILDMVLRATYESAFLVIELIGPFFSLILVAFSPMYLYFGITKAKRIRMFRSLGSIVGFAVSVAATLSLTFVVVTASLALGMWG